MASHYLRRHPQPHRPIYHPPIGWLPFEEHQERHRRLVEIKRSKRLVRARHAGDLFENGEISPYSFASGHRCHPTIDPSAETRRALEDEEEEQSYEQSTKMPTKGQERRREEKEKEKKKPGVAKDSWSDAEDEDDEEEEEEELHFDLRRGRAGWELSPSRVSSTISANAEGQESGQTAFARRPRGLLCLDLSE